MAETIHFRITLVQPTPDVTFALQRGQSERVSPQRSDGSDVSFDFELSLKGKQADGNPNFTGPFAQGPSTARFVYISSGSLAGDMFSCWTRRAKVPVFGIDWAEITEVLEGRASRLEASIQGRSKDGGPVCASIKLLGEGWKAGS
jgi:hypothetical protein